ncbi:MAG: CHAD domain-containing protein [Candidatus Electrothrix sp. AUS1_2]|nr:CHAD domain-containing protein [Candidatus Electrothrix sp. AUS1_2]
MEEDYKAKLPEHLQEGLRYFFADLAEQRQKEQKALAQALQAPQYKTIIKDWKKYLRQNKKSDVKEKAVPIGTMADSIIRKRFQRVLRDGQAIDANSPDENLHRLRIQGKKLRYSLEFFTSLYPAPEMKALIRQLKNLQNNLGLFNDLSVQQDMLNNYLGTLKPGSDKAKKMGAAIGGLLTNLYHEQQQVRSEFEETFRCFSSEENISLYKELFGTERKSGR